MNATLIQLRDNPRALIALLALANVLSLLDLSFTLRALALGATEGNPLMAWLFGHSTFAAAAAKVGMVAGLSLVIWRLRRYRAILALSFFAISIFGGVVIYHVWMFARL